MGSAQTFVQVRMAAQNLVLGAATRRKGSRAHALVDSVVRRPQERAFRVWSHVEGLDHDEVQDLAAKLEERYSMSPRLAKTPSGHSVVYDVFPHHIKDAFWGALLAFQTAFGPPWVRFAGGKVTIRAQGRDCEPQECAARLKHALALAKTDAEVELVEVPDHELEELRGLQAWRDGQVEDDRDPPPSNGPARSNGRNGSPRRRTGDR